MKNKYPQHLLKLIEALKKLPGVGNKSAERFAFQLLQWPQEHLSSFADVVKTIPDKLKQCAECGCLREELRCDFCHIDRLKARSICVIASPRDAFAIEETHEYKGFYHVLGGVLSPLEGFGVNKLNIPKLKERIKTSAISEVVIALDSTLEGDATALYIKNELEALSLNISRLAFGLPMGSSLDFVDGGTLARAFSGRLRF